MMTTVRWSWQPFEAPFAGDFTLNCRSHWLLFWAGALSAWYYHYKWRLNEFGCFLSNHHGLVLVGCVFVVEGAVFGLTSLMSSVHRNAGARVMQLVCESRAFLNSWLPSGSVAPNFKLHRPFRGVLLHFLFQWDVTLFKSLVERRMPLFEGCRHIAKSTLHLIFWLFTHG